jgi:diguanylate cyclase (GGDEF)-like protein
LTGLTNRRQLDEDLRKSISMAIRYGLSLSAIMLDVDHFKTYNDAFGHPAGDEVLRTVAATLLASTRTHDLAVRYGGEEFLILLPATDAKASRILAERLRAAIAAHSWPLRPVTASFGIATMDLSTADARALVEEADRALYHSKAQGRNRVTHHDDLRPGDSPRSG